MDRAEVIEVCSVRKSFGLPCCDCKWAGAIKCPNGYILSYSFKRDPDAVFGEEVKDIEFSKGVGRQVWQIKN